MFSGAPLSGVRPAQPATEQDVRAWHECRVWSEDTSLSWRYYHHWIGSELIQLLYIGLIRRLSSTRKIIVRDDL